MYGGYACILNGDSILVETEKSTSVVANVIASISENLTVSQKQCFGTFHGIRFYYEREGEFCFIIGADEEIPLRILISYLSLIKKDFYDKFVRGKEKLKRSVYKIFMRRELEFFLNNAEADKIRGISIEVDQIKDVMINNVQKSILRGEKLDDLQEKTAMLEDNAHDLARDSDKLKCSKWLKYYCCCFVSCCSMCIS